MFGYIFSNHVFVCFVFLSCSRTWSKKGRKWQLTTCNGNVPAQHDTGLHRIRDRLRNKSLQYIQHKLPLHIRMRSNIKDDILLSFPSQPYHLPGEHNLLNHDANPSQVLSRRRLTVLFHVCPLHLHVHLLLPTSFKVWLPNCKIPIRLFTLVNIHRTFREGAIPRLFPSGCHHKCTTGPYGSFGRILLFSYA